MATTSYSSFLLSMIFLSIISSSFILHSVALNFVIGGRDGWILNPKENYDHWSHRLRFQVNDTILFRYSNTTDSVLAVSKSDYDNCNVDNAVIKLENNGNSYFKFGHSGPFYFITGNKTNCQQGQKLLVVVLGTSHHRLPSPPPSTASITPVSSPPVPAPAPVISAPVPAPVIAAPVPAPVIAAPEPSEGGEGPFDADNAPSPAPTASSAFSGVNCRLTVLVGFIMMSLVIGL